MADTKKKTAKKTGGGSSAGNTKKKKSAPKSPSREKEQAQKVKPLHLTVMPVLLFFFAVLLLIFFLSAGHSGSVGAFIVTFFRFLFGGGRFLLPCFLFPAAFFWRKNWKEERLLMRSIFSAAVFLLSDALFCYFPYLFSKDTPPMVNWAIAAGKEEAAASVGGGVIGNFLCEKLVDLIGFAATGVLLIGIVALLACSLFGTTPAELVVKCYTSYQKKRQIYAEILAEEQETESDEDLLERERERIAAQRRKRAAAAAQKEERHRQKQQKKGKFNPDVDLGVDAEEEPADDFGDEGFDSPLPSPTPLSGGEKLKYGEGLPEDDFGDFPGSDFGEAGYEEAPSGDEPSVNDEDELTKLLFAEDFDEIMGSEEEPSGVPWEETGEQDPKASIPMEREPLMEEDGPLSPPPYRFPPITLLKEVRSQKSSDVPKDPTKDPNALKLVETLRSFRVNTRIVNISRGPTITRYELLPERGVRVRAIANLVDDIAMSLAAEGVRIEAPIPGKEAVGVEVPNRQRETVYFRTLLADDRFKNSDAALAVALGANVAGEPVFADLAKMPHLLIAGTTGSGKSVCMNCLILSLLFKYSPDDVKMIMIDPKRVEFNSYNGLPHLITPVVNDAKKAAGSLNWAVNEMERRYGVIEGVGVKNIKSYNSITKDDPEKEHMPYLVLFIDELADLMTVASSEVETSICRIAQKGRAAGLHLVIGTQRPSVDVITGLIKSNVPSRVAFSLPSQTDSRTVLDASGAEKLIGRGDMLYAPLELSKPVRLQGALVSDEEVEAVTVFIKENAPAVNYDSEVMESIAREAELCGSKGKKGGSAAVISEGGEEEADPMLEAAIDLAVESGKISTSLIQRRLSLGYGRAAKLIDKMQQMGIVSEPEGQKPRTVLLSASQWAEMKMRGDGE